jgi:hypothetical protein
MALPAMLGDREVQKFVEDPDGDVAVRTYSDHNIISSESGNKMAVNDANQAGVRDESANTVLSAILDKLECIEFQLKLITGA